MIETNHADAKILEKRDRLAEEFEKRIPSFYSDQKQLEELPFLSNGVDTITTEKYHSNYFVTIFVLLQRILKVKTRNWRGEFVQPFIEKTMIAVGIGLLYLQVEPANMGMRARVFAFLNFNISLTFGLALRTLIGQIPILAQERSNTSSYRISAFFIAKTIEDLFDFTVYPFIFGLIVYFMTGMSLEPGRFFTFVVAFGVYNWACMGFAQALVCVIPIPYILGFMSSVLSIYFILVSGAYGPTMLTIGLQWTSYLSYIYYGFRAMAINEFSGVIIPVTNGTVLPSNYFTNGTYFLAKTYNIYEPYYMCWVYIAVLLVYFILCKVVAYLGLRYIYGGKSPKRLLAKFVDCCRRNNKIGTN